MFALNEVSDLGSVSQPSVSRSRRKSRNPSCTSCSCIFWTLTCPRHVHGCAIPTCTLIWSDRLGSNMFSPFLVALQHVLLHGLQHRVRHFMASPSQSPPYASAMISDRLFLLFHMLLVNLVVLEQKPTHISSDHLLKIKTVWYE